MSNLKAARAQIYIQKMNEVSALAMAADRAELSGDRDLCIDLVQNIFRIFDDLYLKNFNKK